MNRQQLPSKLRAIIYELLQQKGYVTAVDVFMKLGYLDPKDYERRRMKRVPYLERVIKVNLSRISFIMKALRRICREAGLKASWTGYNSWGKGKKIRLRFSKTGNESIERAYATHFVPKKKKQEPDEKIDISG